MKAFFGLQEAFADLLEEVDPSILGSFISWLDFKLADYKVHGQFVKDDEGCNTTIVNSPEGNGDLKHACLRYDKAEKEIGSEKLSESVTGSFPGTQPIDEKKYLKKSLLESTTQSEAEPMKKSLLKDGVPTIRHLLTSDFPTSWSPNTNEKMHQNKAIQHNSIHSTTLVQSPNTGMPQDCHGVPSKENLLCASIHQAVDQMLNSDQKTENPMETDTNGSEARLFSRNELLKYLLTGSVNQKQISQIDKALVKMLPNGDGSSDAISQSVINPPLVNANGTYHQTKGTYHQTLKITNVKDIMQKINGRAKLPHASNIVCQSQIGHQLPSFKQIPNGTQLQSNDVARNIDSIQDSNVPLSRSQPHSAQADFAFDELPNAKGFLVQSPVSPDCPELPISPVSRNFEGYTQNGDAYLTTSHQEIVSNETTGLEERVVDRLKEIERAKKRGPPRLIEFREEEPVAKRHVSDSSVMPYKLSRSQNMPENGSWSGGECAWPAQPASPGQNVDGFQTNQSETLDLSSKASVMTITTGSGPVRHINKLYKCGICNRTLLSSAGYNRHIRVHSAHHCQRCGAVCDRKNYKTHRCFNQPTESKDFFITFPPQVAVEKRVSPVHVEHVSYGPQLSPAKQDVTSLSQMSQQPHMSRQPQMSQQPHVSQQAHMSPHHSPVPGSILGSSSAFRTMSYYEAEEGEVVPMYVNQDRSSLESTLLDLSNTGSDSISSTTATSMGNVELGVGQSGFHSLSDLDAPQDSTASGLSCPICHRTFLHLSSLNRHLKVHQGIYTHACAVCGRRFTRNEHFLQHKCSRRPKDPKRMVESDRPLETAAKMVAFPPSMAMALVETSEGGRNKAVENGPVMFDTLLSTGSGPHRPMAV